jgi:hypothetical protein
MEAPQANSELFRTGREGKTSIHSAQTGEAKDAKVILRGAAELHPARA